MAKKPKAKKFIDRKSAVTFNLVHRSQRDPLVADETAPQRVLVPVGAGAPTKKDKEKEQELTPEQRKEQQQKYGVFFDDDYNYLQHLKDTREVTLLLAPKATHKRKEKSEKTIGVEDGASERLNLPSSVFASELEEDVGMLNKAAPQGLRLDLDPDVVAALDEDFDFEDPENALEDNFMELAMAERDDEDYSDEEESDDGSGKAFASDEESEDDSDDSQRGGQGKMPSWDEFAKEETKSRFSQYSMSSSVMRRNEGLTLLDHRFEKMFASYDDTELGPLDCEEIEGVLPDTHAQLLRAAEEMAHQQHKYKLDKEQEISRITRLQEIEEESESDEQQMVKVQVEPKERWDCESILSTHSNIYNHPSLIQEPRKPKKIKINPKTGIPLDTIGNDTNKLTIRSLAKHNAQLESIDSGSDEDGRTHAETVLSTLSVLSIRPKDETAEDKRDRKRLLKEYRRERRTERKANQEAFREEKKRQEKIMMNNRNNVQGNRIL